MRRTLIALLLAATAATAAAQTRLAASTFTSGTEGWLIAGPAPGTCCEDPLWWAGLNGGESYIINLGQHGIEHPFFVAPPEFRGDQSAAFGGTLAFKTYSAHHSFHGDPLVTLTGGNTMLVYAVDSAPGADWVDYAVPLTSTAGWRVAGPTWGDVGLPATARQLRDVLANLDQLTINADWSTGVDSAGLDQVRLLSAVPEPSAGWLLAAGMAALALRRRFPS